MFYAVYSEFGISHIDASAQMLAFDTKEQRAKVLAQINQAHALDTDCAAWPVTYREACAYKNVRRFMDHDCVREEICFDVDGRPLFHYFSREFMCW